MKKTCIKILSVALCAVMMLGAAPLGGLVELDLPQVFDLKAEAATYSGTCGDNLTWSLNTSTGALKIIGTGSMQNYSAESTPWYLYRGYIKTVNIPNSLTTIGNYAFYDCSSLTNVTIPNGVTAIGNFAFRYCSKLTSVKIPDSVITIGDDAFYSCYNLTSVTIPDSVTTIGNNAFADCYSLKSITIGNSVTTIGFAAFDYCSSLTSITIPSSVTTIGYAAFDDCDFLTDVYYESTEEDWNKITIGLSNEPLTSATIHFAEPEEPTIASGTCGDNLTWTLYESGLLEITGTGAMTNYSSSSVPWYSYRSNIKTVNIASGVTTIGSYAFYGYDSLTSVTISDSVTTISGYAFRYCDRLANITVDANNKNYSSNSDGVLFNKGKTTLILYPGDNTRTSYTIPDSVTTIGSYAFYGCNNLTSITIPDSVTTIGDEAFRYCNSLTSITIPDSVTSIGDSAFYGCFRLTSITIPDSVTHIGSMAFASSENLTNVTIPDSVTTIGDDAFLACFDLTSITVDENNKNYSSDSYGVLFNKDKTTLIQYPIGNTRTSYTIPNSVTTIGERAFAFCTSLTSITIHDSVTSIDDNAFISCNSLTSIIVDENNKNYSSDNYGVLFNKDKTTLIQYPAGNTRTSYTIPDSVTTIGDYAFYSCDSLTSITIPDSVTTIGDWAFYSCDSLTDVYYTGTEAQWKKIAIDSANDPLKNATIHYNHVHALNNVTESVDPTCTETGYTKSTCVCGYSVILAESPALGHDIVIDKAAEPTCSKTGLTEGQHCSRCDDATIKQEVVPALKHKDTRVKVAAKAPTCTEIGWDAYEYCTACTYTTYAEKPALKHDIVIDKAVDSTCTETGLTEGQHCSRCDDATIKQEVVPVKPHNYTAKHDSAKHWEECNCGSKTNIQNHTFVGGNVCSCGFKRTVDSTIKINNNNGSKTINYGETLKLMSTVTDKPANAKIYWYVDGEQKGEGEIFNVNFESGTKIITVRLVDENGVIYQNANGEEIYESENVTVNAGFFQKLISFFKNLFRMNRTVVQ